MVAIWLRWGVKCFNGILSFSLNTFSHFNDVTFITVVCKPFTLVSFRFLNKVKMIWERKGLLNEFATYKS